jgi:hypothetical protein
MIVMGVILVLSALGFGILLLRLHHLPEHIAHKSQKIQYEIVAVLGLIAMFTHMNIFWIAALILALIDLPDFGTPLSRIADSAETIAGTKPGERIGVTNPNNRLVRLSIPSSARGRSELTPTVPKP